jgi:hypothetical protein
MDTAETADESRAEARASLVLRTGRIAVIPFAMCAMYVLSIGPAVAVIALTGLEDSDTAILTASVVYAPVLYLEEHTRLEGPLKWYAGWWEELGHRLR